MNKILMALGLTLLATTVLAGPGGKGRAPAPHGGRPSTQARQAHRPAAVARPATVARPAVHHRDTVAHHRPHPVVHPRPMPRPHHVRHWVRPPMPPRHIHARHGWTWIATPWTILVNGVYCAGEGYWYDGYNYYYNDCYYTAAPVSIVINI